MTPKRKSPRTPRRPTSTNGPDGMLVILEEIRGQMKVVIEAVQDCATKRELADFREEVEGRFVAVDARFDAMDARFDAMDARFDAMDVRANHVDEELRGIRQDAALRAQSSELRALEHRVLVLEKRVAG